MHKIMLLAGILAIVTLSGCASSVPTTRPEVASADDAEFHAPRLHLPYSGERRIREVNWPDYNVTPVRFGRDTVHTINYPGWRVNRLKRQIIMHNRELRAEIRISSVRAPDLELMRQARLARMAGVTVSDLTVGADARFTSHFSFELPNASPTKRRIGHLYSLYTDYRDPSTGAMLFGHWPAEHDEQLHPQLKRIAKNLVILECSEAPRG